jgi:hypothetical protein
LSFRRHLIALRNRCRLSSSSRCQNGLSLGPRARIEWIGGSRVDSSHHSPIGHNPIADMKIKPF